MALGIPTVASPVGASKELIEHNVNGLLVATESEWLEHLTMLVQDADLRKSLGMRGRETIVERYSVEVMLPRLVSVLQEVMKQ